MTAPARFLFFLAVLALFGCTPAEKPTADPGSKSEANLEEGKEKAPAPSGTASTNEMKLDLSSEVVTLNQEAPGTAPLVNLSDDLVPLVTSSEMTPLEQTPMVPFEGTSPETTSIPSETTPAQSETAAASFSQSTVPQGEGALVEEQLSTAPRTMKEFLSQTAPSQATPSPTTPSQATPSPTMQETRSNPFRDGETSDALRPGMTASVEMESLPASDDKPPTKGRHNSKGEFFDPIEKNGPIFVDWPKPDLALVMTGRQNGYIEPCGCAGFERMQGGLSRRATLLHNLAEKRKWPVVAVDVGNQVKGNKRQTELKFQHTANAILEMGYSGVGLGIADLQLPAGELAAITSNENGPFVSANIDLLEPDTELIAKYRIVERGGVKVGITAVLGNSFREQINSKSILTTDPVSAIEQVAEPLKKCDVRVLLAYATSEESIALAKRFPMFNVVVTAAGGSEPPKESVVIPGTTTYLVEVGEKGVSAIVLGIYRDKVTPVRYQRVPMDSRFVASKKIQHLMSVYQGQLKMLGLEGLEIKPVPCAEAETKGKYVGSKACETCHEQSYDIWRKSKHAKGWETLVKADPPRNHDPECISCHVIGWSPQGFYPFVGGFVSSEKTPELENVGCETCHGPGGAHVEAEAGANLELQERLQKAMIVTIEESRSDHQKMCYNCHDLDNSPEFDFDRYWPEVKHYETETGEKEEE